MATQTVQFACVTGQTVTVKLFAADSDTVVASVSATEATNRKGIYTAAFTDVAAGTYQLIALTGSTPLANWWVDLTLTTATFVAYEIGINTIQSGMATSANQTTILDRQAYTLAVLAGACSDPQTASETYVLTIGGSTYTVDMAGQTSTGTRTAPTLTKS